MVRLKRWSLGCGLCCGCFEQIFKVIEAIVNSPVGDMLGKAFNYVAEKLFGADNAAKNLKGSVEETVTPVSELTQNLEKTPEPIDTAAGKMDELKTQSGAYMRKLTERQQELGELADR